MEEANSSGAKWEFIRPQAGAEDEPTPHLYVANCGPSVGLPCADIQRAFVSFGDVASVSVAGDSGTRVIVSFRRAEDAAAAKMAWSGRPCALLGGRTMHMQYSALRACPTVQDRHPAITSPSELGIPGLVLYLDFVSAEEEKELLAAVDSLPWQALAKRRVQHFGYEFLYKSRNVNPAQKLGDMPDFAAPLVGRISILPELSQATELSLPMDQLTINEYPKGVGLSPHIDTHSPFEGSIISLSLAGPCVMEFRQYSDVSDGPEKNCGDDLEKGSCATMECNRNFEDQASGKEIERKALFLPQRSLLVLSDEARYAWHHYIPHHKIDLVAGQFIPRCSRRVSFTFRKVRSGCCECKFAKYCDSQATDLSGVARISNSEEMDSLLSHNAREDIGVSLAQDEEIEAFSKEGHWNEHTQPWTRSDFTEVDQNAPASFDGEDRRMMADHIEGNICMPESVLCKRRGNDRNAEPISPKRTSLPTPEIEKLYVHKVYDAIAPHFSATRFAKWPKVAGFLNSLAPGSLVVDSGCGNGKYLGFNPNCFFIGCDISPSLVAICARRGHEALVADALQLPCKTGIFDAALSIAVLHHLSNDQRRIRAIEELVRVVSPGGKVLITVWAREQEDEALVQKWTPLSTKYMEEWGGNEYNRYDQRLDSLSSLDGILEADGRSDSSCTEDRNPRAKSCPATDSTSRKTSNSPEMGDLPALLVDVTDSKSRQQLQQQEYFVPWHLPYHRAEINGGSAAAIASGFARQDEKKGAVVYDRYYHVFAQGELERLAAGIEGAEVIDRFYDKSNWCVILKKLSLKD